MGLVGSIKEGDAQIYKGTSYDKLKSKYIHRSILESQLKTDAIEQKM